MSRSIKKYAITKYAGNRRKSWKRWKKIANRFNRRNSKKSIMRGEEGNLKDRKLCSWDYDFCKCYFSKDNLVYFPRVRRK